jgi:hypothetical protein
VLEAAHNSLPERGAIARVKHTLCGRTRLDAAAVNGSGLPVPVAKVAVRERRDGCEAQ